MADLDTAPIVPLPSTCKSPPKSEQPRGSTDLEITEVGMSSETLLPQLYDELRRMARQLMAGQPPSDTLQATALVHESWIKLGKSGHQIWGGQSHFLASATQAMRHILIDRARRKLRQCHGGGQKPFSLDDIDVAANDRPESVLQVDSALNQLALLAPDQARLVELRYFCGLKMEEAAAVLGISTATAKRQMTIARAWLFAQLSGDC